MNIEMYIRSKWLNLESYNLVDVIYVLAQAEKTRKLLPPSSCVWTQLNR